MMRRFRDQSAIPSFLKTSPRAIARRPGTGGCGLWIIRIVMLPHTIAGLVFLLAVPIMLAWVLAGTDQQAPVTRCEQTTSVSKGKTSIHHNIYYTYTVDGRSKASHEDMSEEEFRRVTGGRMASTQPVEGATVRVRTIGHPPLMFAKAMDAGRSLWSPFAMVLFFCLFWNGLLYFFIQVAYLKPIRTRSLYRDGVATNGEIIEKFERKGRQVRYCVKYQFIGEDGAEHTADMVLSINSEYDAAQVGQKVIVLHPQNKSTPSVIYELGDYRCQN